uniref:Uncharacterized protein n=1 Tax=Anopheles coluzzii TaxID=1518534 RepID=A0A8W7PDN5_ANOCL
LPPPNSCGGGSTPATFMLGSVLLGMVPALAVAAVRMGPPALLPPASPKFTSSGLGSSGREVIIVGEASVCLDTISSRLEATSLALGIPVTTDASVPSSSSSPLPSSTGRCCSAVGRLSIALEAASKKGLLGWNLNLTAAGDRESGESSEESEESGRIIEFRAEPGTDRSPFFRTNRIGVTDFFPSVVSSIISPSYSSSGCSSGVVAVRCCICVTSPVIIPPDTGLTGSPSSPHSWCSGFSHTNTSLLTFALDVLIRLLSRFSLTTLPVAPPVPVRRRPGFSRYRTTSRSSRGSSAPACSSGERSQISSIDSISIVAASVRGRLPLLSSLLYAMVVEAVAAATPSGSIRRPSEYGTMESPLSGGVSRSRQLLSV